MVDKLKDDNLKLSKVLTKGKSNSQANRKGKRSKGEGKDDGKKRGKNKKNTDNKYAWKKVPPKEEESHTKDVNGKTYHWCPHHSAWTIHTLKSNKRMLNSPNDSCGDYGGAGSVYCGQ